MAKEAGSRKEAIASTTSGIKGFSSDILAACKSILYVSYKFGTVMSLTASQKGCARHSPQKDA
jgi:hypothetical protein